MLEIPFSFEAIECIRNSHTAAALWIARWSPRGRRPVVLPEQGGLLVADELVHARPARNTARDPESEFAIDPAEFEQLLAQAAPAELIGTYHSHPNGNAQMSEADAAMAGATGLLLIVATGERWQWRLWDPVAGGEIGFAIAPPRV